MQSDPLEATLAAGTPTLGSTPLRLGPYVVLENIGEGGMGVVFAAYDPRLERKVAIKLLHERTQSAQRRLIREARALARISHPNVVQVYDVGTHEGGVYIAMDHVKGETLKAWMHRSRDAADIARVFAQAGRGLAAAHAVGLVHRDFKPENVLVCDDAQRVVVLDFGIARETTATESDSGSIDLSGTGDDERAPLTRLTRTGTLVGTPAYMSPEQYRGKPADASSDQFSLCVALHEALFGERPFQGAGRAELAIAVMDGRRSPPPEDRRVPTWLTRICDRGLQVEPDKRFASMNDLVAALERGVRARPRAVVALTAGAGVASVLTFMMMRGTEAPPDPCAAAAASDALWNEARRKRLQEPFERSSMVYAEQTLSTIEHRLDEWVALLSAQRRDACEATVVRHEQSSELFDRRMACLADRARDVDAVVDVLVHADESVVERATKITASLPDLGPCADTEALGRAVPLPVGPTAAAVDQVRAVISLGTALKSAGKYAEAQAAFEGAIPAAIAAGYGPVHATTLLGLAQTLRRRGQPGGRPLLDEAFLAALRARDLEGALSIQMEVARLEGVDAGKLAEGRAALELAEALAGDGIRPRQRAWISSERGSLAFTAGLYDEAREQLERSLEIRAELGETRTESAAWTMESLAMVFLRQGEYELATQWGERSLDILAPVVGPEHPELTAVLNALALTHERRAQYPEAVRLLERARAITSATRGTAHANNGIFLQNIGGIHLQQRDLARARGPIEQAVALLREAFGAEHVGIAGALGMLGDLELRSGNVQAAAIAYQESLELRERAMGPRSANLMATLIGLARVAYARNEPSGALRHIDRALNGLEGDKHDPEDVGNARFIQARAFLALEDRAAALASISAARDAYARGGPTTEIERRELEAWLRDADL